MQRTKCLHNKVNQQAESWIASNIWLPLGYCCYDTYNITNSKCRCNSLWVITSFFLFQIWAFKAPHQWLIVCGFTSGLVCHHISSPQFSKTGLLATATGEWHKTDQFWLKCWSWCCWCFCTNYWNIIWESSTQLVVSDDIHLGWPTCPTQVIIDLVQMRNWHVKTRNQHVVFSKCFSLYWHSKSLFCDKQVSIFRNVLISQY